ncbi:MAG: bifunctional 4-hydroxy-2-oxoglutarate aldolase/2-dehydro-3-deoxy-phosphogluconate aldolase [Clostridia bacterium]|nr:bifunctional 4-hydroxy-2-oxoglutarate aldolase/2-dehydro-3-deoxy-phosphogluconate aldolase [Clostridia bacterium]
MLNREEIIKDVEKNKIIVIMRGFTQEQLINTVEAMWKGGIRLVEVTYDQSGRVSDETTASNIQALSKRFAGRVRVGAGTVLTERQVELAYKAGAEFIISPDCYEKVIRKTRELGMVSMPGAFTPTEVANAYRYGADFVKLFPNSEVKISYLKALTAPLSHIKFLSVGGVNAENMLEYFAAGAKGIGVGTGILDERVVARGDYKEITRRAQLFTEKIDCLVKCEKGN